MWRLSLMMITRLLYRFFDCDEKCPCTQESKGYQKELSKQMREWVQLTPVRNDLRNYCFGAELTKPGAAA